MEEPGNLGGIRWGLGGGRADERRRDSALLAPQSGPRTPGLAGRARLRHAGGRPVGTASCRRALPGSPAGPRIVSKCSPCDEDITLELSNDAVGLSLKRSLTRNETDGRTPKIYHEPRTSKEVA